MKNTIIKNPKVKITNQLLFSESVDYVDVNVRKNSGTYHGDVEINGKCFSGEHGAHDYEKDYGFIIEDDF